MIINSASTQILKNSYEQGFHFLGEGGPECDIVRAFMRQVEQMKNLRFYDQGELSYTESRVSLKSVEQRPVETKSEIVFAIPSTLLDSAIQKISSDESEIPAMTASHISSTIETTGIGIALVTSIVNGIVTPVLFNPIDVVSQSRVIHNKKILQILREKSVFELYRGLSIGVAGGVLKGSALLVSMKIFEDQVKSYTSNKEVLKFASGAVGGIFEAACASPIDNAKVQLRNKKALSYYDFVCKVTSHQSPRSVLYKGFEGTCARNVVFNGVFQLTFEKFKQLLEVENNVNSTSQIAGKFLAGGLTGIVATTACFPINITILHQRHEESQSLVQTAYKIYRENGALAFTRGYLMSALRVGLSSAVFGGVVIPIAENIYSRF